MNYLTEAMVVSFRESIVITTLTSSSLALFFFLPWIGVDRLLFYGVAALSAIVGSAVSGRIERNKLLWGWIIFGTASTLSLALLQSTLLLLLSVLAGISLGFGLSSCFAILAENTVVEERTRISAFIVLELFLMVPLIMFIAEAFSFGLTQRVLLVATARFICFLPMILIDPSVAKIRKKSPPFSSLFQKNFMFYILPWIFFNIAAGLSVWWYYAGRLSAPVGNSQYNLDLALTVFYICTALFALLSGFISDRIGRKLPSIIGIVTGGISFAILSYSTSDQSYLVSVAILGIAWGFLLVVYIAIPGDIAGSYGKEKFYTIGTIIPLVLYLGINAVPRSAFDIDISKLFPIISIFLFLAVIPILVAQETLPSNKIKERKMKKHLQEIGKLIEESKK